MKRLTLLSLLASGVAAQAPQPGVRIPQEPSVGVEKSYEALPVKNGIPTATDIVVPTEHVSSPRAHANRAVMDAATQVITKQLADPDFVVVQESPEGTVWAGSHGYKTAFEPTGWRFIGRPAPGADATQPIAFQLTRATVGSMELQLQTPSRTHHDRRVEYAFGSVVESIDIDSRGVEQTFTFESLPQRGELTIEIAATTALAGQNSADGVVFRGAFDHVSYSQAIAIDADGRRIAAPTTFTEGRLEIHVPADFVAHAVLPLRVDPLITSLVVDSSATNDLGDPDIAWDEATQTWEVVYSRYFGGADWDCYAARLLNTAPLQLLGTTTIDFTGASWQRSRIANVPFSSVFMVVCQVKSGTNPWKIAGSSVSNTGTVVTGQFDIATSGVDELHPDIGGDPYPGASYFTVVWEHSYSATDHDVYARQVTGAGILVGPSPIYVQTNGANQTWPTISKSDGGGGFNQRYTIVYQQTFSASDEDIYGSMLTYDGQFVPVAGFNVFPIATGGNVDLFPVVSSPTLADTFGTRKILAVYESLNPANGDVVGVCFDQAGNFLASADINVLEGDATRLFWPQYRPSVDSDGHRFVVGYHELYNNNPTGNDLDTRVTVVEQAGTTLIAEEAGVALGFSGNREFNIQVASRYSGAGFYSPICCTTNDRDGASGGGFAIDAYRFDVEPQGEFTYRTTGCGSLAISASGQAIPGGTFNFALTSQPNISGYVLGSAANAPIGPCPGCTLGVDGFLAIGQFYTVDVPLNPSVVGFQFSAQGFVFQPSGAPCLNQLQFSDTIDVTIG